MADRYVLGFKTHTRFSARARGVRFMTCYCNSDSDATSLAQWLEQNALANYTKVTVSKVIREAGPVQIPDDAEFTDVNLVSMTLATSTGGDGVMQRFNVKVPIKYEETGDIDVSQLIAKMLQYCKAPDGASFESCISVGNRFYNVVEGGGLDIDG